MVIALAFFITVSIFLGARCIQWHITALMLTHYIHLKTDMPNEKEIRECTDWVYDNIGVLLRIKL